MQLSRQKLFSYIYRKVFAKLKTIYRKKYLLYIEEKRLRKIILYIKKKKSLIYRKINLYLPLVNLFLSNPFLFPVKRLPR